MGIIGAAHWSGAEDGGKKATALFLKSALTNSTMMKLGTVIPYLKKIQKTMNY